MNELLTINVNDHTEKKNGLTYLSWAWAWSEVLKIDPTAKWIVREWGPTNDTMPVRFLPDGSAMVSVGVLIKDSMRECYLPVMNHKNQAIKNPDAFAINTAIMRCLAKAIAMHGLGLYIYAGEDLPESLEDADPLDQPKNFGLTPARAKIVRAVAAECLQKFNEGDEWACYEAAAAIENNEEKLVLWGILKPHSAVRSCIKALSEAESKKAAELAKQTEVTEQG